MLYFCQGMIELQFKLIFVGLDVGCLLRSLPGDVIFDNSTGVSFTCDLNDNIPAPWPSSSSFTSLSLCAPGMSFGKVTFTSLLLTFHVC